MLRGVFALSTGICCFGLGTWLGGRVFVPAGSGLAGPAIAVGYGVAAAAAGAIGAALLGGNLSRPRLRLATMIVTSAAVALGMFVIVRLREL